MTHEPCRMDTGSEAGHEAVYLSNDLLLITVLPRKGADIYTFIHKPTGIDVLWKNPIGLWPPGAPPHDGHGDLEFMYNYEGCWQELFPSCNDPSEYNGRKIPFHGEVATLRWDWESVTQTDDEIAARFTVFTRQTTFKLERTMRLKRGEARLYLDETVTNVGAFPQHFVWGHHCVVGGPWLEPGSRLDLPAHTIVTSDPLYEPATARLAAGQREPYPFARGKDGGVVDLSVVPGIEAFSHDDMYITDLDAGYVAVTNPRLDFRFSLHWDVSLFKWVISWQPYGGAVLPPFKRMSYCLGIEPWISNKHLGAAAAAGEAVELAPGAQFSTQLYAEITHGG